MFFKTTFKFHSWSDKRFLLSLKVGKCHQPSANAAFLDHVRLYLVLSPAFVGGRLNCAHRQELLAEGQKMSGIYYFQRCTLRTEISPNSPNILQMMKYSQFLALF